MASAGQMAEFFATLGFKVDKADIQKVDKTLDHIENRIKKVVEGDLGNLKVQISGFRFTEGFNTRLYKAMQKKMSILNGRKGLSPEISVSKFDIDRNALLRETRDAVKYVENNLRMRITPDVGRPQMPARGTGASTGGVSRFGTGMGVGAAAGSLGRGFIPGLGLAFGVSQMNKLNQQLIGQELAATAVFGNQEAGQEQLDWVRNLGNQIGFDYRSQANPYMKMAAAGRTAGMGTGQVQEIFKGMAEYGRVMGLNDEDMKGSMRAVEQMLNKGQVYAEELKMQLGEKFPAAIQLMAEAVSGGDTEKLFDMMEKGEVSSIEALPKFAKILSRQARVGGALTEAMKTSLAEQMRFNNTFNDMVMAFSDAGFEKGQAGIFRIMGDFLSEMGPLVESFGEAWQYVGDLLRVPLGLLHDLGVGLQSLSEYTGVSKGKLAALSTVVGLLAFPFTRTATVIFGVFTLLEDFTAFLSGRGSAIGNFLDDLKEKNPKEYKETVEALKTAFEEISEVVQLILSGWQQIFELMGSDGFASAAMKVLRATAREVGATAEALMRIMKAFGYKDPNETEADRLRKMQERAEAPKSTMEVASGILQNYMRDPLGMMFGIGRENAEEYGARLESEKKSREGSTKNPFLMSDQDVKDSYFTDSQTYRIGGGQQIFADSIVKEMRFEGFSGSDEDIARIEEAVTNVIQQQIRPIQKQGGSE